MPGTMQGLCWNAQQACGLGLSSSSITTFRFATLLETQHRPLAELGTNVDNVHLCCATPAGFAVVASKTVYALDCTLATLWATVLTTSDDDDEFNTIVYYANTTALLLGCDDGSIQGINAETGEQTVCIAAAHENICMALAASQLYPEQLFSGGLDGYLRRWSHPSASKVYRLEALSVGKKLNQLSDQTRSINPPLVYALDICHRDGLELLAVGVGTGDVMLYQTTPDRTTMKGPWVVEHPHRAMVTAVCFAPVATGWLLVSVANDRELKLLRVQPNVRATLAKGSASKQKSAASKKKGKRQGPKGTSSSNAEMKVHITTQLLNNMTCIEKVDRVQPLMDNTVAIIDATQRLHLKSLRDLLTHTQLEAAPSSAAVAVAVASSAPS